MSVITAIDFILRTYPESRYQGGRHAGHPILEALGEVREHHENPREISHRAGSRKRGRVAGAEPPRGSRSDPEGECSRKGRNDESGSSFLCT